MTTITPLDSLPIEAITDDLAKVFEAISTVTKTREVYNTIVTHVMAFANAYDALYGDDVMLAGTMYQRSEFVFSDQPNKDGCLLVLHCGKSDGMEGFIPGQMHKHLFIIEMVGDIVTGICNYPMADVLQ